MDSKEQQAILTARHAVLLIVDRPEGTIESRLKQAGPSIHILATAIGIWVDNTAVQYRAMGYEPGEFCEDIREWFMSKQFFVDEDINDITMMRCHLSNVGWGRHVIMSFRLHGTKKKGSTS